MSVRFAERHGASTGAYGEADLNGSYSRLVMPTLVANIRDFILAMLQDF